MNLESLFYETINKSSKYKKYFHVYEKLFFKYKNKEIVFVEIGIDDGGSLELWKKYFGPKSKIIGIDINPLCKKFENLNQNIHVEIGDQSLESFWIDFFEKYGKVDVILDDGGHTNNQQIITCANTIPNIKNDGLLLVEDVHTSYLKNFNSSMNYSFINFSKTIIDDINSKFDINYSKKKFSLNDYVYSIQFFESFVAFFIDSSFCDYNKSITNSGTVNNVGTIYRSKNDNRFIKNKFYSLRSLINFIKNVKINILLKKYFK
jgi:23S rRNA U2552 (ribose-2'-O)-methylase RlmE/FtsJ